MGEVLGRCHCGQLVGSRRISSVTARLERRPCDGCRRTCLFQSGSARTAKGPVSCRCLLLQLLYLYLYLYLYVSRRRVQMWDGDGAFFLLDGRPTTLTKAMSLSCHARAPSTQKHGVCGTSISLSPSSPRMIFYPGLWLSRPNLRCPCDPSFGWVSFFCA